MTHPTETAPGQYSTWELRTELAKLRRFLALRQRHGQFGQELTKEKIKWIEARLTA